ncbi:P-loop containing nucleoside triphosphate hydrolase protein [Thozetella sp. PMI_491]|nr:P-loop containing nucleoside triphosphate hydrolase protein [Thozetella sp. PMI_491]
MEPDHDEKSDREHDLPSNPDAEEFEKLLHERLDSLPGLAPHIDTRVSRLIDHLVSTVSRLKIQNDLLAKELDEVKLKAVETGSIPIHSKSQLDTFETGVLQDSEDLPRFETFHCVNCSHRGQETIDPERTYRDIPRLYRGDSRSDHIRGLSNLGNLASYLKTHPKTAFAIRISYSCTDTSVAQIYSKTGYRDGRSVQDSPPAIASRESIVLGQGLQRALEDITKAHPKVFEGYTVNHLQGHFPKPYFFFYMHNETLLELSSTVLLSPGASKSLRLLFDWMENNWRSSWNKADELFSRNKVNRESLPLLFRPSELVVKREHFTNTSLFMAAKVQEYLWRISEELEAFTILFNGDFGRTPMMISTTYIPEPKGIQQIGVNLRNLEYDISSLPVYPIRFAAPDLQAKLVARGSRFWSCRKKKLVCYYDGDDGLGREIQDRYMIDYAMYRRLYPDKDIFSPLCFINMNEEIMDREDPPDDVLACLPPTIYGFSFSSKSWRVLRVDRITDVIWNKDAFRQLVATDDTKELIQAVVTAHGQRLISAPDIIEGKGKGLLILLHGGPGTGKTLTAESIADQQERPLYRVTCGDIGTEPADVETYLSAVLEIGKAWGCVVLLDEADVFLEERSFTDQKRNAIISIFLRVLEYYDGILILTTNRVGSFDEAFKSRIQLALWYPKLEEEDRLKIWHNFVQMLAKSKERMDIDDLEMNLHRLARFEMNGRQIRNVITMSRHLAKYRKEILRFKHMHDAVKSVLRFNEYLDQVKGVSDDIWAREDKLR